MEMNSRNPEEDISKPQGSSSQNDSSSNNSDSDEDSDNSSSETSSYHSDKILKAKIKMRKEETEQQMELGDLSEDDLQMMMEEDDEEAGPSCYIKSANEILPNELEKHGPKLE